MAKGTKDHIEAVSNLLCEYSRNLDFCHCFA